MTSQKPVKDLITEFEEIIAWFDNEDIDIEQATKKLEQGSALAEEIKKQLAESKNQIEVIKQKFDL